MSEAHAASSASSDVAFQVRSSLPALRAWRDRQGGQLRCGGFQVGTDSARSCFQNMQESLHWPDGHPRSVLFPVTRRVSFSLLGLGLGTRSQWRSGSSACLLACAAGASDYGDALPSLTRRRVSSYAICRVQGSPRRRVRPFHASTSCASCISPRPPIACGRHRCLDHWLT